MPEIDVKKCGNIEAGCSKEDLMRYYSIDSEEKWDKTLKETKLQEDAKAFSKKGGKK